MSADEQTAADSDQTASDSDQTWSDRDQASADDDQRAADDDVSSGNDPVTHQRTASVRARTTHDREAVSMLRDETATARSATADERDRSAELRDRDAEEDDRAALRDDRFGGGEISTAELLERIDRIRAPSSSSAPMAICWARAATVTADLPPVAGGGRLPEPPRRVTNLTLRPRPEGPRPVSDTGTNRPQLGRGRGRSRGLWVPRGGRVGRAAVESSRRVDMSVRRRTSSPPASRRPCPERIATAIE
jgi:hypothetical protein